VSWKREGDTVTLTMSREDWDRLLMVLGVATAAARKGLSPLTYGSTLALVNRLNDENPEFRPYEVPAPAAEART
jgi:hypothetical protein